MTMPTVQCLCPNMQCQRPLSFDRSLIGTVQQCPSCAQQMYVPDAPATSSPLYPPPATGPVQPPVAPPPVQYPPVQQPQQGYPQYQHMPMQVYTPPTVQAPPPQPAIHTEMEHAVERKLNMSSGCFAMFAMMFAIGIMGCGFGSIFGASEIIMGIIFLLAGLAGIGAFIFFGYFATATATKSKTSERK